MTKSRTDVDLGERLVAAIEAGDVEAVADVYADDVVIWHNTDQTEQSKAENLAVLGWLVRKTVSRSYREIRRSETERGFVQQHVLHLEFSDGRSADLPACLVVEVTDGHITRLDEYVDNVGVMAAFGRNG
jgi:ketosteroid isomerase-like protein